MNTLAAAPILFGLTLVVAPAWAQGGTTLAERLGFEADAKLLIVHADDIGLARSVNVATARAFEAGAITSGSVMVPCPWFPDFAAYYREHPSLDVGIHLTLTAEWDHYKWGGISPAGEIPSLLDSYGHFPATVEAVGARAVAAEAERELRAQIERAIALGIRPTHLDTHMGSVMAAPELVQVYLKLGKEYHLPVLTLPRSWAANVPDAQREVLATADGVVDGLYMVSTDDPSKTWSETYAEMIAAMGPGLNVLIVHLAIDDTEMQAVTVNHPDFGAAWRQKDLDFVTGREFKDLLRAHGITLVTWGQIRAVMGGR